MNVRNKTKFRHWFPALLTLAGAMVLMCGCSLNLASVPTSGSETGNAKVLAGMVTQSDGSPAANTRIALFPQAYNPVKDAPPSDSSLDTTDETGRYGFKNVKFGFYSVSAKNLASGDQGLQQNIIVDSATDSVPTMKLKKTGSIHVALPGNASVASGYVYIAGTDLSAQVQVALDSTCYAQIDSAPAGNLLSIYYYVKGQTVSQLIADSASVSSDSTAYIQAHTSYFVSTMGNDTNSGTAGNPLRHLSKAVALARAGDSVVVMDGVYDNEGAGNNQYVVTLSRSGALSAWITIMAQHRGKAVLDAMSSASAYFALSSASYFIIQGFVIQNGYNHGINSNNIHHAIIRWNEIRNIANRVIPDNTTHVGLWCDSASHDIVIEGNMFHDIGRTGGAIYSQDHALDIAGYNVKIINNIFYNQKTGWDIQTVSGFSNAIIANNVFAFANPNRDGMILLWQ
ncbi:MAG: DUF1565 domain-containing protein, partial [Chitinivibrionales bacterium]|nr:DUF1565 domain-containing protein [Chitinivibrionales bacterium]